MAVSMIGPKFYAWDRCGKPLAFGKLYTYQARTNIPKATYQSEDAIVENTNPIILNGEGYANVYLAGSYKMVLKDDKENEIWTSDPVTSPDNGSGLNYVVTAVYVGPSSYKVLGDHTSAMAVGSRVRLISLDEREVETTVTGLQYINGFTNVTVQEAVVQVNVTTAMSANGVGAVIELTEQGETILAGLSGEPKGNYTDNPAPILTTLSDYVVYNGLTYKAAKTTPLPYQVNSGAIPDPADDVNLILYSDINSITGDRRYTAAFKADGNGTAIENMIAGRVGGVADLVHTAGNLYLTGGTVWESLGTNTGSETIEDFEAKSTICAKDFHDFAGGDATTEMLSLASVSDGKEISFPIGGSILLTQEVNFKAPRSIDFGDIEVSYDRDQTTNPITVGQNIVVEKSTLSAAIGNLTNTLVLDDVSDIEIGSMLSIYDPTDYSYSGWRPDYRKGEYQFVAEINGSSIVFNGSTVDGYDIGSKVYLVTTIKCALTGKLTVNNTGSYATSFGLRTWGIVDSDMSGLEVRLNNGTHCLSFAKAVNCKGGGMVAIQSSGQVDQREYGLVQSNCMSNDFQGRFHAERHGSTVGSDGQPGGAINRFLRVTGRVTTTGLGFIQAADFHGDSEHCSYGGYLEGVTSGGHDTIIEEGSYVFSPVANLAPLTYSELKSTKHTAKNVTVVTKGVAASRGAIDAGGNSSVITENTVIGGNFDFRGSHLMSDDHLQLITIKNRGATGIKYGIILDDVTYEAPNATSMLACVPVSGDDVDFISFNNDIWKVGLSSTASNADGIIEKGKEVITLDILESVMTATVVFDTPFPTSRIPNVKHSLSLGVVGGVTIAAEISSSTVNGFDIRLYTADGSTFTSAVNITVNWIAEAMPR